MSVEEARKLDYETLRKRMYEGQPGSDWWLAVKTEIDIRNAERMAELINGATESTVEMAQSTREVADLVRRLNDSTTQLTRIIQTAEKSGRRVEWATWIILVASVVMAADVILRLLHLAQ